VLPWEPFELGSVTDLVSIFIGLIVLAFTVFIALRQLKIMRKQTEMMAEQTAISKRQEAVATEQAAITKRQGEIAEVQHRILTAELSRRTDVRIIYHRQEVHHRHDFQGWNAIEFHAHNGGNKSADGFYWEVLVSDNVANVVRFLDESGMPVEGKLSYQSRTERYQKVDGHYTHKLFPYSGIEVIRVAVAPPPSSPDKLSVKWRIRGEDGMVPPAGLAEIIFERAGDGLYEVIEWKPPKHELNPQS